MQSSIAKLLFFSVLIIFSFTDLFSQDSAYYAGINVSSATLVSDLEARVRSPFQSRTYSEYRDILIPNYEAQPVAGSLTLKMVTCVYSSKTYTYTPPFVFSNGVTNFSREHTYCQSWWNFNVTTNPYYSDFHHLFLTEQDHANGVRGNNPLGNVTGAISSSFLDCKQGQGIGSSGTTTVFEPRAIDKGDAARGMLYMVLMYDNNGSYGQWSIKWLNQTKGIPQDYATLINWSRRDPPDKWEIERNNYIASLQQNRNPFIDHPEYLKYISLFDMTKLSPVFAAEPTYQVNGFSATALGNSITVNWTNPAGTQAPSGYLLQAYNVDNYFSPIDGDIYPDSLDLSTGKTVVNIPNDGRTSYTFSNLALSTKYYLTMYSYNGDDTLRNYKLQSMPRTNITTEATVPVELVSFTASAANNLVTLNWKTATEINNNGFDIERGSAKNSAGEVIYNKIGFVPGSGSCNNDKVYSFTDKPAVSSKYYYRLKQVDYNGSYKLSNVVEVIFHPLVKGYYLDQNFPNPFNPSTTISYTVPAASNVRVTIFNTLGQSVRVLENGFKDAGTYQLSFDAGNLNSGTYFYKIEAGEFTQTRKMSLVK
jgi:endonuclease I